MGAWIEILKVDYVPMVDIVAPHMGAWIEIKVTSKLIFGITSHPTWVRGLK